MHGTGWFVITTTTLCVAAWMPVAVAAAAAKPSDPPPATYLSDTDVAYRYLAKVQASEADDFGKAYPDFKEKNVQSPDLHDEAFRALGGSNAQLQAMKKFLDDQWKQPLPTKYENPHLYVLVRILLDKLREPGAELHDGAAPSLRVGTLLKIGADAETLPVPQSDQHVVVMNRFLFTIIQELTKVGVDSLRSDANADVLARRLGLLLDSFNTFSGRMPPPDADFRTTEEVLVVEKIAETLELFVLAHEFAHVLLKHENAASAELSLPGQPALRLPVVERSWRQEIEADVMGSQLVLRTLADTPARPPDAPREFDEMLRQTPPWFFVYLGMIEDAKQTCDTLELQPPPDPQMRHAVASIATAALQAMANPAAPKPSIVGEYDIDKLRDHPPPWARLTIVETAAEMGQFQRQAGPPMTAALRKRQAHYANLGSSAYDHLLDLWPAARRINLALCKERASTVQQATVK